MKILYRQAFFEKMTSLFVIFSKDLIIKENRSLQASLENRMSVVPKEIVRKYVDIINKKFIKKNKSCF